MKYSTVANEVSSLTVGPRHFIGHTPSLPKD